LRWPCSFLVGCCLIITSRSPRRYRRKRLIKRLNRPAISDSEKQPRISTRRAVSTNRASRLLRSLPILCPESLLTCLPADDSVSPSSRTRCSLLRIWPRPRADPEDSSHLEGEMIRVCSGNCESKLFRWAVANHRRKKCRSGYHREVRVLQLGKEKPRRFPAGGSLRVLSAQIRSCAERGR